MNYRLLPYNKSMYQIPALLISGLLLCLLFLSACSASSSAVQSVPGTSTAVPAPTIDPTLQNQGDIQLQTFQQWISLLQKYHGNITTYQQQYTGDQQALQSAKTSAAYKTALATLNKHVQAIQIPAMKVESQSLLQQLQQEVTSWGQ